MNLRPHEQASNISASLRTSPIVDEEDEVTPVRRALLLSFVTATILGTVVSQASAADTEVKRIGLLFQQSAPTIQFAEKEFWSRLQELGWTKDQNVQGLARYADGDQQRLPLLMRELVQSKVDLVVAPGTQAAIAAVGGTKTIPILSLMGDPVGVGLVKSLARPEGNLTGVSLQNAEEVPSKWIELLREVSPNIRKLAILVNPDNPLSLKAAAQVSRSAAAVRIKTVLVEARTVVEFEKAVQRASQLAQAAVVCPDNVAIQARQVIADQGRKYRLPIAAGQNIFVESGALLSYGPDDADLWRRMAQYADKLLRGARPGDLPIEQPTQFKTAINLRTAGQLMLEVPQSLVLRADEVIR